MYSLHISSLFVARTLRCWFDVVLGPEDCAGVVKTTSSWLKGERRVKADRSTFAVEEC